MEWSSLSTSSSLKHHRSSEWADFALAGPMHLSTVNWSDDCHHCCIAACLVQGIYILHQKDARAAQWWESFHFQIVQDLKDDDNSSIVGAIFHYAGPYDASVPSIAIAFRGTATTQDWKMNYRASVNELHETSRFQRALQAVELVASQSGNRRRKIWLCGHSLGAALAMLVGKRLAKVGVYLDTFLFNPPFVLRTGGRILSRTAFGLLAVLSPPLLSLPMAVKYALRQREASKALQSLEVQQSFANLCSWVPRLFVNSGDFICSDYVEHFEKRKQTEPPKPTVEELEHPFIIPSANLIKNLCMPMKNGIDESHGLSQWWKAELKLQSKEYICVLPSP